MRFLAAFAAGALVLTSAAAQTPSRTQQPEFLPDSYVVRFKERSFDLEPFRRAMLDRRPVAEIEAIVESMEQAVRRDQAGFASEVLSMGGRITAQWWIINGAAFSGPAAIAEAVRKMPGVEIVERDRMYHLHNDVARNSAHHRASQANNRQNGAGQNVNGTGVGVAILDTGCDDNMAGSGRPHRGFFRNGDPNDTSGGGIGGSRMVYSVGTSGFGSDDLHGHGTHVAGSVLNAWSTILGMAPDANLIAIKMSNNSGSASSSWMVSAWNEVARVAATHNILAANNSFSGSPDPNSSIQRALDSCAHNADVMITCSAGNSAGNTANSQNVWNGLAVGALTKNSLSRASFSAQGPLDNFGRIYPDISAVGASVRSLATDDEASFAVSSGTSMSSPMVAGAAALVRHANGALSALETKALLLNNTRDIGQGRNNVGLGIIDCDRSVERALASDVRTVKMDTLTTTLSIPFTPDPAITPARVTIAFNHAPGGALPNVDLFIFDASNTQVGSSSDTLISYDRVEFTAQAGQQYRAELRWVGNVNGTLDVAVAGVGSGARRPALTAMNPASATSYRPAEITLTGTDLDQVTQVNVGSTAVTNFTIDSPTQLRFKPPSPFDIASHPVTAENAAGASNAMNLAITGSHPGVLESPTFAFRDQPFDQEYWTDRNWQVALFLSISNQPSDLPGIVSFTIGGNFSTLWYLTNVPCDASGHAVKTLVFPATAPTGPVYFQAIAFDPNNLSLPLETTTDDLTSIF